MGEHSDNSDVAGANGQPQRRVADGEGNSAPLAEETGHAEYSIFDGAGNESVVAVSNNSEGTGKNSEDALADAESHPHKLGKAFGTAHGDAG